MVVIGTDGTNVAVTGAGLSVMAGVHVPVPLHGVPLPPLQPSKLQPLAGTAVSVGGVPSGKLDEHVPGQEIPAGMLVTVPCPTTLTPRSEAGS